MRRFLLQLLASAIALLCACKPVSYPPRVAYPAIAVGSTLKANLDKSCVKDYRPDVDYFPDKLRFTHSTQLSVSYGNNFKRLLFRPAGKPTQVMEYLFVQCGTPAPEHSPNSVVVEVPVLCASPRVISRFWVRSPS